jgi:hypothetical protein
MFKKGLHPFGTPSASGGWSPFLIIFTENSSDAMPTGPKVKLAVDLHKIHKYFPIEFDVQEGFSFEMMIDRQRYDEVEMLLQEYKLSEDTIIREFCFILIWIEKETLGGDDLDNLSSKYYQMWIELDNLKQYLMHHRIISISLHGEYERHKPGKTFSIKEEINIDRLCDGIRSIFKDEFHSDQQKRTTKGLTNWKRRKMVKVKNNILNYFTSIPTLDELSLEEQNELIERLSRLAGLPEE